MPLPRPNEDDSEKVFVTRCMGNPTMNDEFPDASQRFKVCQSIFRKKGAAVFASFGVDTELINLEMRKGSGGTVLINTPIAQAEVGTLRNGPHRFKLTEEMLDQMVDNLTSWIDAGGPPLPGYFGHAKTIEDVRRRSRGKEEPALLVHKAWKDGKTLWGTLEFMPDAWERTHRSGARPFRGLSIVFNEQGKSRTGSPIGAVLHGVDIVPEPFFPIQIAAARWDGYDDVIALEYRWMVKTETEEGEDEMTIQKTDDKLVSRLESEIEEQKTKLSELDSKVKAATERVTSLESTIETKDAEIKKLKGEIVASQNEALGKEASEAIVKALEKGVLTKAEVEGFDESPAKALEAFEKLELFRNPAALLRFCDKAGVPSKVTMNATRNSGRPPTKDSDDEVIDQQDVFLSKVDAIIAENKGMAFGEALVLAAEKHPKAYRGYLEATDRDSGE